MAHDAICATLETLGERLFGEEARHLAAQLPPGLDAYLRLAKAKDTFDLDDFYRRVAAREGAGVDLPQAVYHARAVVSVLQEAVSPGEMRDVREQLPAEYAALFAWQDAAATKQYPLSKCKGDPRLFELSIIPLGTGSQIGEEVAEAVRVIDTSGLPYRLTPTGTCIEGEWEEVMPLLQQCHNDARARSSHVITSIKIEDDAGAQNKLQSNISAIEQRLGKRLSTG
jgi:uncharacterized protein (TIGR00106 family)